MDLALDPSVAQGYKSASQIARLVTEHWGNANLYCLACASNRVVPFRPNMAVLDYRCPNCTAQYQLKSKSSAFGRKVSNSAYERKITAIREGHAPHYAFLRYSRAAWQVADLFIIPSYFFSPAVVEQRAPLRATARRSGWVGSNILLYSFPLEARVDVVSGGQALSPEEVRHAWSSFAFLGTDRRAQGGSGADILSCIRDMQRMIGSNEFGLQEFYAAFEGRLAALHAENRHVKDKIRQQLQVLRDNGVLEFLGQGRYRVLK